MKIHLAVIFLFIVTGTAAQKTKTMDSLNMEITRVFDAPVELVWKAWTDGEQVKRWWGPVGFTAPVAKMDFREGGSSLVCMRSPQGMDMFNTWNYTKIIPMQYIEFVQGWANKEGKTIPAAELGFPPGFPEEVRHVLIFKTLEGGKTELTITEFGYSSPQIVELSRAGMGEVLDKLAASILH